MPLGASLSERIKANDFVFAGALAQLSPGEIFFPLQLYIEGIKPLFKKEEVFNVKTLFACTAQVNKMSNKFVMMINNLCMFLPW